jgi:hypothetical protein
MKNSTHETSKNISKELVPLKTDYDLLLYVGRFCPTHIGHQAMMGGVIEAFEDNHIILLGSCNEPMSLRNIFTFSDRRSFIKTLFPASNVAAMPDFKDDDSSWFHALDDMIRLKGYTPERTAFIGGCKEDVQWYYDMARNVHIVNRFQGTTVNVSGTEIRDHLIGGNKEKLETLIDPKIVPDVLETFSERWTEFRNK